MLLFKKIGKDNPSKMTRLERLKREDPLKVFFKFCFFRTVMRLDLEVQTLLPTKLLRDDIAFL
ncbi:MAG TPA: hypothetical protein DHV62_06215 [Elusimicrobia bacterium]|jgi:hypothetical protein|nr:hypothetical protein [Elusimicrobiota bacterium]